MKIKQLTLYTLIALSVFQTIRCTGIETLDLITAQPDEIAQAIKPHTVKLFASKAIDTGLANIPLANLKELLANEQLAAKIVTRMNYINDITKDNVHLFIQPIANNFDHINQHTFDWVLYLNRNNLKSTIPIFVKNFKTIIDSVNDNNLKLILKILQNYPDYTSLFEQPIIDNFLSLTDDWNGCLILFKIMELYPDSIKLFIQPIIDNFSSIANDTYGHDIIVRTMRLYPDSIELFVQPTVDSFSSLANDRNGSYIILQIIEHNSDTAKLFTQSIIDNFSSLLNNDHGRKLILKILEYYPDIQEKHFSAIKTEKELILLSHIMKLTTATEWNDQYLAHKKIIACIKAYPPSIFMQCIINNFTTLANSHLGRLILLKILKLHPETGQQLAQAAIDNIAIFSLAPSLPDDHAEKQLLTKLIEHNPQVQKALDNYQFKYNVKAGLIIGGTFIGCFAIGALSAYVTLKIARYAALKFGFIQ